MLFVRFLPMLFLRFLPMLFVRFLPMLFVRFLPMLFLRFLPMLFVRFLPLLFFRFCPNLPVGVFLLCFLSLTALLGLLLYSRYFFHHASLKKTLFLCGSVILSHRFCCLFSFGPLAFHFIFPPILIIRLRYFLFVFFFSVCGFKSRVESFLQIFLPSCLNKNKSSIVFNMIFFLWICSFSYKTARIMPGLNSRHCNPLVPYLFQSCYCYLCLKFFFPL